MEDQLRRRVRRLDVSIMFTHCSNSPQHIFTFTSSTICTSYIFLAGNFVPENGIRCIAFSYVVCVGTYLRICKLLNNVTLDAPRTEQTVAERRQIY